jgi:hypothetical protein
MAVYECRFYFSPIGCGYYDGKCEYNHFRKNPAQCRQYRKGKCKLSSSRCPFTHSPREEMNRVIGVPFSNIYVPIFSITISSLRMGESRYTKQHIHYGAKNWSDWECTLSTGVSYTSDINNQLTQYMCAYDTCTKIKTYWLYVTRIPFFLWCCNQLYLPVELSDIVKGHIIPTPMLFTGRH